MRSAKPLLLALACSAGLACGGPISMLPGGSLSGPVEAAPPDWAFSDSVKNVQLETRPANPYSVTIWGVGLGPHFYVAAGRPDNRWLAYVRENPEVRLRVEGYVYELRATEVSDEKEREVVLEAMKKKYDFEPEPDEVDQATLFRLDPR